MPLCPSLFLSAPLYSSPVLPGPPRSSVVLSGLKSYASDSLLSAFPNSARGCRFSPAVDIWHAALILAKEFGCHINLNPQLLRKKNTPNPRGLESTQSAQARSYAPNKLKVELEGAPRRPKTSAQATQQPSIVSALANVFGTHELYRMLDRYGWKLDRTCDDICGARHGRRSSAQHSAPPLARPAMCAPPRASAPLTAVLHAHNR